MNVYIYEHHEILDAYYQNNKYNVNKGSVGGVGVAKNQHIDILIILTYSIQNINI